MLLPRFSGVFLYDLVLPRSQWFNVLVLSWSWEFNVLVSDIPGWKTVCLLYTVTCHWCFMLENVFANSGIGVDTWKSRRNNPAYAAVSSHVVCSAIYTGADRGWSAGIGETVSGTGCNYHFFHLFIRLQKLRTTGNRSELQHAAGDPKLAGNCLTLAYRAGLNLENRS